MNIYNDFLSENAPLQVNVQKSHVEKIEEILNENEPKLEIGIFAELSEEVKNLLKDTYSRFKESKEFEEYREAVLNGKVNGNDDMKNLKVDYVRTSKRSVSDAFKDIFKSKKNVNPSPNSTSPKTKTQSRRRERDIIETTIPYQVLDDFKM